MKVWHDLENGRQLLTPHAISAHLRGLLDSGYTFTEAKTVLLPWADPHELAFALAQVPECKDPYPNMP